MSELIRAYDSLYNGFLESMVLLDQKSKTTASTAVDENELLERISRLECEKQQDKSTIELYLRNNDQLESELKKLGQTQREYQTLNEKLQTRETHQTEELRFDLEREKVEARDLRREKEALEAQVQILLENLQEGELRREREQRERSAERKAADSRREKGEAQTEELRAQLAQAQASLAEKTREVEQLLGRRNEYHRKYNLIQQLNKAGETTIRALQKDLAEAQEERRASKEELQRTRGEVEDLVRRWRLEPGLEERARELAEVVGETVSVHENLDEAVSMGSAGESNFEFNRNLKMLDKEFAGVDLRASQRSGFLGSLSNLGSLLLRDQPQMKSFGGLFSAEKMGPSSFLKLGNLSSVGRGEAASGGPGKGGPTSVEEILEKPKAEGEKEERKRFIKAEFQTELQQILDRRINSKMKVKTERSKKDILEKCGEGRDAPGKEAAERGREAKARQELRERVREAVLGELGGFRESELNDLEREALEKKFEATLSVEKWAAWVVRYFREKLGEERGKRKATEAESSRLTRAAGALAGEEAARAGESAADVPQTQRRVREAAERESAGEHAAVPAPPRQNQAREAPGEEKVPPRNGAQARARRQRGQLEKGVRLSEVHSRLAEV